MDVKSIVYDKINGFQLRDGKELIRWILRRHSGVLDVIMDVGCGSGNVTKLLGKSIPHNRFIALDIDPNMVQFAENNHSNANINFVVQDITQPWGKIDPKIRDLEGSVDLIFANYVLHWLKEADTAFVNLIKLLKPEGVFYFTVPAHRLKHHSLQLDSIEVQMSKICKSLKRVGFHDVDVELKEDHWEFDSYKNYQEMIKLLRNFYLTLKIPDIPQSDELGLDLEDLICRIHSVQAGQDLPEKIDSEQSAVFYDYFRGRAEKRNQSCRESEA